jgi:SGNH domain (fused to AT3 domains)
MEQLAISMPEVLIMFSFWSEYGSLWEPGSAIGQAFHETIRRAKAAGVKRIIVVGPAPLWVRPLPRVAATAWLSHPYWTALPLRLSSGFSPRPAVVDRNMRNLVASLGIEYFSVIDALCNREGCLTRPPGSDVLMTWDHGHFTNDAARFVADQILTRFDLK